MRFQISREMLLAPLSALTGVVERRHTLPVLANILMRLDDDALEMTASDCEVQLVTRQAVEVFESGSATVPARKFLDIIRLLPDESLITLEVTSDRCLIRSGSSRFNLATLPVESYPAFDHGNADLEFELPAMMLRTALEKTAFAIAQQDVRYYLRGVLIDLEGAVLRTVASDGHRLAVFHEVMPTGFAVDHQIIVPRKGVLELCRLLGEYEGEVRLEASSNALRVQMGSVSFSTKLIEGRYPDYRRVFPPSFASTLHVARDLFRGALSRVGLITTEKQRSIRLETLSSTELMLSGHNTEQDDAEERLEAHLEGQPIASGFNAQYLSEAISHVSGSDLRISFSPEGNSCLVEDPDDPRYRCVVMPMRL